MRWESKEVMDITIGRNRGDHGRCRDGRDNDVDGNWKSDVCWKTSSMGSLLIAWLGRARKRRKM